MPSAKIDPVREHRDEYATPREPVLVTVGRGTYLATTGTGAPRSTEFRRRLGALYGAAYTLKFALKKERGLDFKVGALEGLWTTARGGADWQTAPKEGWRWKLLIRVPDEVTASDVRAALAALERKTGEAPPVRLERLREGRAVQLLHVGTYASETSTLARMDAFVKARGLRYRGAHHEIYLSDPRRVPAWRLRTILRHPVASAVAAR